MIDSVFIEIVESEAIAGLDSDETLFLEFLEESMTGVSSDQSILLELVDDGVFVELTDSSPVVGVEILESSMIELWIESDIVVQEVQQSDFLEFHDGRGPAGPQGNDGASQSNYVHVQTVPASVWVINHNLNTRPPVTLFETAFPLEPVETDKLYPDLNNIIVEWPQPTSGWAYL